MAKCGKGCMPECEYFTTGGCISPFNCPYKIETGYINFATSTPDSLTDLLIEFDEMGFAPTTPCSNSEEYAIGWRGKVRKEIERLQAENAALRERLDEAVELPAKIGDTVYKVYDKCDGHNCPYNGDYGQWRCHYEGERRCKQFIIIKQFCYSDIPFVNKTIFVLREAAEARLKELQGGEE